MPTVWRLRIGATGEFARHCLDEDYIALGFRHFGQSVEGMDKTAIQKEAKRRYEGNGWRSPASTLNRFANVMAQRDIVLVPSDDPAEYLVGEIAGEYQHSAEPLIHDYHHHRAMRWYGTSSVRELPPATFANLRARNMLIQPRAQAELLDWARRVRG
jgi:predicted Mrr-cat superfamily restriction endonuclease